MYLRFLFVITEHKLFSQVFRHGWDLFVSGKRTGIIVRNLLSTQNLPRLHFDVFDNLIADLGDITGVSISL